MEVLCGEIYNMKAVFMGWDDVPNPALANFTLRE